MDRAILLVAGVALSSAGIGGLLVAALGLGALETMLPPLGIDRAALGRTVAALAVAVLVTGLAHLVVGIRLGRARWASSAGLLLAGLGVVTCAALAAAATTALAARSLTVPVAIGAAVGAALTGLAYAGAGWSLVRRIGAGGRS